MPDGSGLSLVNDLRSRSATNALPVIVLGEQDATEDECVRALEAGAADYVKRPYGLKELLARLQAVLRPVPLRQVRGHVSFETLTMDFDAYRALVHTDEGAERLELKLAPTCFRLLRLLIENPYVALSRKTIVENVWFGANVKENIVDGYVRKLRQTLEPVRQRVVIETVRGVGFRLSTPQAMLATQASPAYEPAPQSLEQSTEQTKPPARQARDEPVPVSDLRTALETIRQLRRMLVKASKENRVLRDAMDAKQTKET